VTILIRVVITNLAALCALHGRVTAWGELSYDPFCAAVSFL
jgi:hypothetical protein